MIYDDLERIEDLANQLERCQRRGEIEIATQYEKELIEARTKFIKQLVRRQEDFENDTFGQRSRRQQYDEIIEEQRTALEESTDTKSMKVDLGDIAKMKQ